MTTSKPCVFSAGSGSNPSTSQGLGVFPGLSLPALLLSILWLIVTLRNPATKYCGKLLIHTPYFTFIFQIESQRPVKHRVKSICLYTSPKVKIEKITLPTKVHIVKAMGFPRSSVGKESACKAGEPGSIPGSGRSPGEGNGNPLQYSCLENPMDGGAWQATVYGVPKSQTRLSDFTLTFKVP